jgi:hypothetical protein
MNRISLALVGALLLSIFVSLPAFAQTGAVLDILTNKPTDGWLLFQLEDDQLGSAVLQRSAKGMAATFRVSQNGTVVREYILGYPFKGRKADLKNTDFQLLSNCVSQFNAAMTSPKGGAFYINVSSNENVGVLCYAQHKSAT